MTKPIICTALMTLYEEGRFRLYDPVAKFIPAFGDLQVLESDGAGGGSRRHFHAGSIFALRKSISSSIPNPGSAER